MLEPDTQAAAASCIFSIIKPELMCKPQNQDLPQQSENLPASGRQAGPNSPQQKIHSTFWIRSCSWRFYRSKGKNLQEVHKMQSIFSCW